MKLIDIINTLKSEGYNITFRHRTDGGLIITSINGKKMGITQGNKLARSLVVGGELSAKRQAQTSYNVQKYIKLKEGEHKAKGYVSDEIRNLTKKVQAQWRKNKTIGEGRVSLKKIRWRLKYYGEKETKLYLERRYRYSQGYAYPENVEWLASRIERLKIGASADEISDIEEVVQYLYANKNNFRDEFIGRINEITYDKSRSVKDRIQEIKRIIGM